MNYYIQFKRGGYLEVLYEVKRKEVNIDLVRIGEVKFISHYFIYNNQIDSRVLEVYNDLRGSYNNDDLYLIPLCQNVSIDKLKYLKQVNYELKNEYEKLTCVRYAINYSNIELMLELFKLSRNNLPVAEINGLIEEKENNLNALLNMIADI
ncbi:hypothetical protein ACMAZF_07005 [Psychrobium sp. nBUS_13]|uniref:hypothetical protein n=1 Tax=Psychrobium sp. nBUS_13 TaxID=3395319 RepID=UPI003EBE593C